MIYHYWNNETFEFSNSAETIPGRIPPNGTNDNLPIWDSDKGEHCVRDIINNRWIVMSPKQWTEHLISIGYKTISEFQKVDESGEVVYLSEQEKLDKGIYTLEELKKLYSDKVNDITSQKIYEGFISNALGSDHHYGADEYDQVNLIGAVATGVQTQFKCKNIDTGIVDYYIHTNAQMKQVLKDGAQRKINLLQNAKSLKDLINKSKSYNELSAIDLNSGW